MSLTLSASSPPGTTIKTSLDGLELWLQAPGKTGYALGLHDCLALAWYVLTNTDLLDGADPRLAFRDAVSSLALVPGFNPGGQRLSAPRVYQDPCSPRKESLSTPELSDVALTE